MVVCSVCHDPVAPIKARGWCAACYQRWQKTGSTDRTKFPRGQCTVPGCDRKAHGKGLCELHYRRQRVNGTLEDPAQNRPPPRTSHDLYPQWIDFQRHSGARAIVLEWKEDFEIFLAGVGNRPSRRHRLYSLNKSLPLGPGNFEWREKLVEKLPGENKQDYQRRASKAHKEAYSAEYKDWNLRRNFGPAFGVEEFNAMHEAQDGVCAICEGGNTTTTKDGRIKTLAVDHDHETGAIRALVCQHCNQGLGFFRDDPELLEKAAVYLRKHKRRA